MSIRVSDFSIPRSIETNKIRARDNKNKEDECDTKISDHYLNEQKKSLLSELSQHSSSEITGTLDLSLDAANDADSDWWDGLKISFLPEPPLEEQIVNDLQKSPEVKKELLTLAGEQSFLSVEL